MPQDQPQRPALSRRSFLRLLPAAPAAIALGLSTSHTDAPQQQLEVDRLRMAMAALRAGIVPMRTVMDELGIDERDLAVGDLFVVVDPEPVRAALEGRL